MAEILYSEVTTATLRDKVVVLTGGAQGIGAATVELFYNLGAHVFFGDWNKTGGEQVAASLLASSSNNTAVGTVHFQQLDVRDYQSQLSLFDAAFSRHGRIDVAVSCAAVIEPLGWFQPADLNLASVRQEPRPVVDAININLTSVLSFARIALAHMQASPPPPASQSPAFTRSLVLVSSIAGITEAPGLFAYSSAKHGVVGLARALSHWAPQRYGGLRVNCLCPWATDTQLLAGVRPNWVREGLPMNQPGDVARQIAQCAADAALNGRVVFVSGGHGFDVEEGYQRTQPLWMGEENAKVFQRGQEVLGLGDNWTDPQKDSK